MQQLQRAGLSLEQIFRAATINNARELKLDSQLGTIEPGKIANLVLLKQSPLESVEAYDTIVTVWVHGRPASRGSLAANSSKTWKCFGLVSRMRVKAPTSSTRFSKMRKCNSATRFLRRDHLVCSRDDHRLAAAPAIGLSKASGVSVHRHLLVPWFQCSHTS